MVSVLFSEFDGHETDSGTFGDLDDGDDGLSGGRGAQRDGEERLIPIIVNIILMIIIT
jgi:hypothetical protein